MRTSDPQSAGPPSLVGPLVLTFLASLGTGVFWNGMSFVARHAYDFEQSRNLLLHMLMGAVYTIGAFRAGVITRAVERHLSPRAVLACVLTLQAAVCALPIATRGEWALWFAAGAVSMLSSIIWPIVESYITAGRHGPDMRSAIGWFNMTWMPAVVVPMLAMAPILENHGHWAIGGLAPINVLAVLSLAWLPKSPAPHDTEVSSEHLADEYPMLLRSARILLPLSYLVMAALSPILPYRFEQLEVDVALKTPCTATWMIARVVVLFIMWRLPFWHGRWGTLVFGGAAMTGGFGAIVLAPSIAGVLLGFAAFGVGLGIIYYTALYYAMAVGHAEVDAGGTHEALIGAGYAIGPIAGLLGTALGGGPAIVAVVWIVIGASTVPASLPYAGARRLRARAAK